MKCTNATRPCAFDTAHVSLQQPQVHVSCSNHSTFSSIARAGFVDYTLAYHRHFTYPNMIVDGKDLLIVSRSSLGGERIHPCAFLICSNVSFS